MDWPMLYTGNPVVLQPVMVCFMHMILIDSENELAMNLGETYLLTDNGNERLGKKKLDLVVGQSSTLKLVSSLKNYLYAVFLCSHNCCDCTRTYLYADLIFLPTVAKQSSRRSFIGSLRSPFKVGPSSLSNFQSFPRLDPLLPRKELLLLSALLLDPDSQSLQKHSRFFK